MSGIVTSPAGNTVVLPAPSRWDSPAGVVGPAVAALLAGLGVVLLPHPGRLIAAAVVAGVFIGVAAFRPRTAIVLTFAFLPAMALVRRLLIESSGWMALDPLLLVGPSVAGFLLLRLFLFEERPLFTDKMSVLIGLFIGVAVLQVANPSGGGLVVGAGGLLYLTVPLLWFFIGRELMDRDLAVKVLAVIGVASVLAAIYGICQTEIGFPSWDRDWFRVVGETNGNLGALRVGDALRAFGPLASASEYLLLLSTGMVICVAFAGRGRYALLLPLPLLAAALFLGSGRSALVLAVVAATAIIAVRASKGHLKTAAAATLALVLLGLFVAAPAVSRLAASSGNDLIAHQAEGLGNPLDESQSTLIPHLRAFTTGIEQGVTRPQGRGTGSTNAATDRLGSDRSVNLIEVENQGYQEVIRGTDIDISNTFLALGLVGGLLYVTIFLGIGIKLVARLRLCQDPALLAVIGIAIATLGQWLTGGHYVLAPLLWLLLGWATSARQA